MLALMYAILLGLVGSKHFLIFFIFLVVNFVASFIVFKLLRYFEGGLMYILIAVLGFLALLCIAYVPLALSVLIISKKLGIT